MHNVGFSNGPTTRQSSGLAVAVAIPMLALFAGSEALAQGNLQFSEGLYAVDEGNSTVIRVVRSGNTTGAVSAPLSIGINSTATLNVDYELDLPTGMVEIADGATFKDVTIDALSDNELEGTEFVAFTLGQPTGGATLGGPVTTRLEIIDEQRPTADINFDSPFVNEVTEGSDLDLGVSKSGPGVASIDVDPIGGTAVLGVDYTLSARTLDFGPVVGNDQTLTVMTIQDSDLEGIQTIDLFLQDPSPAADTAATEASSLVRILDDEPDQPGDFELRTTNGDTTVDESVGSVSFTVDRVIGSTGAVAVDYATLDGTGSEDARADVHYTADTDTLSFADTETSRTFSIGIIDDDAGGPDSRQFQVVIVNPNGVTNIDPTIDPQNNLIVITILENDGSGGECERFCDCFIATAAYGSHLDPHVETLRDFRDDWLMTNASGRAFVAWYYETSPPIAEFIGRHDSLRWMTRLALMPMVYTVAYPRSSGLVFVAGLILLTIWRRRRRGQA